VGGASPSQSYLNIPAIIAACEITGAGAIHPGYGFLSENAHFAEIVAEHGIVFIGPRPEHIRLMGDKIAAKKAVKALGIPTVIAGAFARDLHVHYAHGIDITRRTEDIDFGLAVPDWPAFENLKQQLIGIGAFREVPGAQHRLLHASRLPVDLVPFQGVERSDRHIDWPPGGEFRMDVFGFREALEAAQRVLFPEQVEALVVSLPALALLKIVAWQDRHYRAPRKDALDLMLIVAKYLDFGNLERLWSQFPAWTEKNGFDTRCAGARMLGADIAALLDEAGRGRVVTILADQANEELPSLLPQEMYPQDAAWACALLRGILQGIYES